MNTPPRLPTPAELLDNTLLAMRDTTYVDSQGYIVNRIQALNSGNDKQWLAAAEDVLTKLAYDNYQGFTPTRLRRVAVKVAADFAPVLKAWRYHHG